ncbi:hypothetical protein ACFXJ5_15545 [Streptomyces sp. NPDC059373]
MTTLGLGTACRPAEATLVIAPGAPCLLLGFLVVDIAGQPLQALPLLPPRPPEPPLPPWLPLPREVAEGLGVAVAEAEADAEGVGVAEAEVLALAEDFAEDELAFGVAEAEALPEADAETSAACTVLADDVADEAGVDLRAGAVLVADAGEVAVADAEFFTFSAFASDLADVPGMRVSGAKGVPPAKATPSTAA